MGTELTGIIDLLRVRLSPEAEIFLGSLHQSSGEIYLLFDSEAPETDRLRWICAEQGIYPAAYTPWARISCGSLLVHVRGMAQVQSSRLLVGVTEFSPGSSSASCPTLRLTARLQPLSEDDLKLRRAYEQRLYGRSARALRTALTPSRGAGAPGEAQ